MKKVITLLFITIISATAFSQKSLIDERNGFKTIRIGASKSSFNNLQLFQNLDEITAYRYNPSDSDLLNVFDNKYDAIILYFDKSDRLAMIMITKEFTGNNFYRDALSFSDGIRDKFIKVFGKFDELDAEDSSGNISVTWYGQKAFYSVGTIYFGIAKGKSESNVVIGKTTKLSSGF